MACLITSGRIEPCKDSLGGLRNVYFINEDITSNFIYKENTPMANQWDYILDNDYNESIDYLKGIGSLYKFELKSNENVFDQEIVSSRENGTTFFRQTLTIKLKKQDIATHNAVKTLAYAKPRILVENNEGQFFLVGLLRGADLTAGSINSGGGLADFSGYSLTFQAEELLPSQFVPLGTNAFYDNLNNEDFPKTQSTIITS
jgi:hypothetical protein